MSDIPLSPHSDSASVVAGPVFVDYLNTTVPDGHAHVVQSELLKIVTSVGATAVAEGLFKLSTGGTFKVTEKTNFVVYGASGDMLAALRDQGAFATYLSALADVPHNVSLMHATQDYYFSDSPKIIRSLVKKVRSKKGLRLSRKRLDPCKQVRTLLSQSPHGEDTGTVYLGGRKAEVWAKAYDKQQERMVNAGQEVPPCTRFELSVSGKAGACLKDAYSPEAIFWHFMSEVLPRPPGAPEWVPGRQGFDLPPKVALLPAEALRRLVESSPQLQQMFSLSDAVGRHGYEFFLRCLNDQYQRHLNNLDDSQTGSFRSAPSGDSDP